MSVSIRAAPVSSGPVRATSSQARRRLRARTAVRPARVGAAKDRESVERLFEISRPATPDPTKLQLVNRVADGNRGPGGAGVGLLDRLEGRSSTRDSAELMINYRRHANYCSSSLFIRVVLAEPLSRRGGARAPRPHDPSHPQFWHVRPHVDPSRRSAVGRPPGDAPLPGEECPPTTAVAPRRGRRGGNRASVHDSVADSSSLGTWLSMPWTHEKHMRRDPLRSTSSLAQRGRVACAEAP